MGWPPLSWQPDGSLDIAATCTITELSRFGRSLPAPAAPLFEQCCRAFLASFKIWNMATVGGNLCNGLPAGPVISLTAALDGTVLLQGQDGATRRMPVTEFIRGAGVKDLRDGEMLRSVRLPARALEARTAFRQASLYGLGRSGSLVIGTGDPPGRLPRRHRHRRDHPPVPLLVRPAAHRGRTPRGDRHRRPPRRVVRRHPRTARVAAAHGPAPGRADPP